MATVKREAFGYHANIGALYDGRQDSFLVGSLLAQDPNATEITTRTLVQTPETNIIREDRLSEKFKALGLTRDVGASLLAGWIKPHASSAYLSQPAKTTPGVYRALVYTITECQDELNFGALFTNPSLRESLNINALSKSGATHIVTGITWGARAIVSAFKESSTDMERFKAEREMDAAMEGFFTPDRPGSNTDENITAMYFGDGEGAQPGPMTATLSAALGRLRKLPLHLGTVKAAGYPLSPLVYTLFPVSGLVFLGTGIPNTPQPSQLSPEAYDKVINLLDELALALPSFNAYLTSLKSHQSMVAGHHLAEVQDRLRRVLDAQSFFRGHFPRLLEAVRTGASTSQVVLDMMERQFTEDLAPAALLDLTQAYKPKLTFISRAVESGAQYVGDATTELQGALARISRKTRTVYVFYFSTKTMSENNSSWKASHRVLNDLLSQRPKPPVLLVDSDLGGPELSSARIAVFSNGAQVVEDLAAQRQEIAGKQLIRYDDGALEKTNNVPAHRSTVQLPCPHPGCGEKGSHVSAWSCHRCLEEIEFGSRDGFFYCDCGRARYDRVGFNCQKPTHPQRKFVRFEKKHLRQLLLSLPKPKEVNILILGETGVGKSTFVNAFINYLTFPSLDEALKADTLHWIIPCSFTHQQHDRRERLVSQTITVGDDDDDERDGSGGQSATQQATVYPLYFKDTLIRLIDTPGIGDTRGLDQDRDNMANILSVLRNYADLHGIIILLKPNNARLGVMFRFCVKELLTHLHRSAAENMVFGFTNTRGSNFTPGDTFKPLETLLSEYNDVIPGLYKHNVYCFDSESFRYLAARKKNIDMGNMDDYRRSWDHSAGEADRLVKHFRQLSPHNTQRTLSLNETRHLILKLTAPMQQISAAITDTISKSEKQMQELRDTNILGEELRQKLQIQKTSVSCTQLKQPKTVCAHAKCVEVVQDGNKKEKVKLRKNLCHNPCCLKNVPVGRVGTPELVNCAAFDGVKCRLCGHHWKDHEHIMVEYSRTNTAVVDAAVQRELDETGDVATAKKKTIQSLTKLIDELRHEHEVIQLAAARFSVYLKSNSITHYNDATLEYLEHLIKDEKTKAMHVGKPNRRLEQLEKDLASYRKFVDAMQGGKPWKSGHRALDEAGVANVVASLYGLPHYGADLKNLAKVVGNAYEANFRERPYRISRRQHWREEDLDGSSLFWDQFTGVAWRAASSMGVRAPSYPSRPPDRAHPASYKSMIEEAEMASSHRSNEKSQLQEKTDTTPWGADDDDFWPAPDTDEKARPAVQSISGWDANGGSSSSGSQAPPPYSEVSNDNAGAGPSSTRGSQILDSVRIVQKKGMRFSWRGKFGKKGD